MATTLLIRPRWNHGESWCGYLLRLANLNSIAGFSQMAKLGEMTYASLVLGQPEWVLPRFGVTHPEVPAIVMPEGTNGPMHQLPKLRRPRFTTVCPDCLRSDVTPFLRARWDFPLEVTCDVHKVRLLSSCPRCKAQIQTRRGRFLQCECGMPFHDWQAPKDDLSTNHLREILAVVLEKQDQLTFQIPHEREVAAFVVLRNIAYAHGLRAEKVVKNLPRLLNPVDRYHILAAASEWFENWPNNFKSNLLRSGWEPCITGRNNLDRNALRLRLFPELSKVWDDLVAERQHVRLSKERLDNKPRSPEQMTLQEVKFDLKVTGTTCSEWAQAGVFGDIKYEQMKGYSRILVDRNTVKRVKSLLQQTISFSEACEHLEISSRVMHVLIESYVVKSDKLRKTTPTARLWHKDLVNISETLYSAAVLVQAVGEMRAVTQVIKNMYKDLGGEFVKKFIFELSAQSVPLYQQISDDKKISNLYVQGSDLRRFCRSVRNEHSISP